MNISEVFKVNYYPSLKRFLKTGSKAERLFEGAEGSFKVVKIRR